ncbi:MAG TPA: hypothetical protein VG755_33460 [Nannocystaceae bacterium]|nr:hypothetical protein [Nannocystaceae bacterium]
MSLRERDVHVTSPCPIDLDETGMRQKGDRWHCGHCSKTVHVLSSMTESDARRFLTEHAGQDVCVSYAMSAKGEIRFRPDPVVPVASLVRRPKLAAAAAIGLGVALAACAPHENPRVGAAPIVETAQPTTTLPTIPDVHPPVLEKVVAGGMRPAPIVAPDDVQVDGGMRPMPLPEPKDVQVEGGLKVPTVANDEPCDPPKTIDAPHPPMTRGGVRAMPPER